MYLKLTRKLELAVKILLNNSMVLYQRWKKNIFSQQYNSYHIKKIQDVQCSYIFLENWSEIWNKSKLDKYYKGAV